jgi:hypothetical protein
LRDLDKLDVNARNNYGRTALHDAIKHRIPEVVKRLLEFGIDPAIRNNEGQTALDFARDEVKSLNSEYGESEERNRMIIKLVTDCIAVLEAWVADIYVHLGDKVLSEGSEMLTEEMLTTCDRFVTQKSEMVS